MRRIVFLTKDSSKVVRVYTLDLVFSSDEELELTLKKQIFENHNEQFLSIFDIED